jgi:ketosteroid isomerase-like protein
VAQLQGDSPDRSALRDLVERYALAVDSRDIDRVVDLFTEDGVLLSHLMPGTEETPLERRGHEKLRRALELGLAQYTATTHLIGGQAVEVQGDTAEGTTVCLAHHLYGADGGDRLLLMAIRYYDTYAKEHGVWRFSQRRLRLDWREDRPLASPAETETTQ